MVELSEKKLLSIEFISFSSRKPRLTKKVFTNNIPHLIAFSCISLIESQLTVLTPYHPKSLCLSVLKFIKKPVIRYKSTNYVSGFNLELYKGKNQTYFNQFYPQFTTILSQFNNDVIQTDIEYILMNFLTFVFDKLSYVEKEKIRTFLLIAISFFQQELIPRIRQINMFDMNQRTMLAADQVNFCSSIYHRWDALPFTPESKLFYRHLKEAQKFSSY